MPSRTTQSLPERRATRRALVIFVMAAVVAVSAFLGARALARDDGAGTPAHTVRDFLVAAVAEHNGVTACRFLTHRAVREVAAVEPRDTPCEAALTFARFTLGGRDVQLESTLKELSYTVEQDGARARVTVSAGGAAHTFLLRKAPQRALGGFEAPPTSWRIDGGVAALVRR